MVDAIATAAIGIGLGLSPFMLLSIGTLIVVAYLILSINVYLESMAFGRFRLGYGYLGPTEIRAVLIALNTALALDLGLDFNLLELNMTVFDVIGLGIAAVMIVLLTARAFGNLRELAKEEPAGAAPLVASEAGRAPAGERVAELARRRDADPVAPVRFASYSAASAAAKTRS